MGRYPYPRRIRGYPRRCDGYSTAKRTSFISVRQGIGKIKIDLPYEIPVRIHYTTLFGDARIFDLYKKRLINESLRMQDSYEGKRDDDAELIITLSTWIGDIEVNRK